MVADHIEPWRRDQHIQPRNQIQRGFSASNELNPDRPGPRQCAVWVEQAPFLLGGTSRKQRCCRPSRLQSRVSGAANSNGVEPGVTEKVRVHISCVPAWNPGDFGGPSVKFASPGEAILIHRACYLKVGVTPAGAILPDVERSRALLERFVAQPPR